MKTVLKPQDYRWVKVKTGEELLMTESQMEMEQQEKRLNRILKSGEDADSEDARQKIKISFENKDQRNFWF